MKEEPILAEHYSAILDGVNEWINANDPINLKKQIHTKLNRNRDTIVMKLLGFDNSWGDMSLDHCNGRSGNSTAGDYLNAQANIVVNEWLANFIPPKISEELSANVSKDYEKMYKAMLKNSIQKLAKAAADKDANRIIDKLSSTAFIEDIEKTYKLINNEKNT